MKRLILTAALFLTTSLSNVVGQPLEKAEKVNIFGAETDSLPQKEKERYLKEMGKDLNWYKGLKPDNRRRLDILFDHYARCEYQGNRLLDEYNKQAYMEGCKRGCNFWDEKLLKELGIVE